MAINVLIFVVCRADGSDMERSQSITVVQRKPPVDRSYCVAFQTKLEIE